MLRQELEVRGLRTVAELARALGVHDSTVYKRIYSGSLQEPTHSVGGLRRKYYTTEEFNKLVNTYKEGGE